MRPHTLALACLLASAAALSACSGESSESGASAAAHADAPPADALPISLSELPTQRAGIWRTTAVVNGEADAPYQECVAENQPVIPDDAAVTDCNPTINRLPNGFVLEGQCLSGGATSSVRAEVTGDFQRQVSLAMRTSQTLPGQEPVALEIQLHSVYQGPCAAGQAPGRIEAE